ncbi:hypothetical protein D187_006154 [Cystobacter fuscus DSM 2262]|uniref:Uncharacterized protein n=1 Tax=Cystobacter fuscus (strain ATCC 25194 / DSM 2262 / NBRC 100088 / M29) TaxID=1242864 RepID=S9PHD1_CYSF2|nr:hypothetical protein D187_006154 [Cystobacter fuscus DSM 2262]
MGGHPEGQRPQHEGGGGDEASGSRGHGGAGLYVAPSLAASTPSVWTGMEPLGYSLEGRDARLPWEV